MLQDHETLGRGTKIIPTLIESKSEEKVSILNKSKIISHGF